MLQEVLTKENDVNQSLLAPYACNPAKSKGRLYPEEESNTRSAFRRDCDRIIHSAAFRRLEYKTQVFVNHEGDHYRTRLTHSLEVAQISRSIARNLKLNEDLAETFALAHDLGHTPFGHAGEDALDECMKEYGGFSHNAQTIKVLTQLEHKYAQFDGLNLTWETLEGLAKHNGPIIGEDRDKKRYDGAVPSAIAECDKVIDLRLDKFASAEAQVSALADDIAYNNHDIEDGLRAGLLSVEGLRTLPFVGEIFEQVEAQYPYIEASRLIHEVTRRMIHLMVVDLSRNTFSHIDTYGVETVDDVHNFGRPLVAFSSVMEEHRKVINAYLMEHMYRHYRVNRMTSKARRVLKDLFELLFNEPNCLPDEWRVKAELSSSEAQRAEVVADFVAGMTDRFAMDEHKRLFDIECKI